MLNDAQANVSGYGVGPSSRHRLPENQYPLIEVGEAQRQWNVAKTHRSSKSS